MQLYDATNRRALCQEVDRLCDTSDTTYTRLDKTARINDALEECVGAIIQADGTWQYDDTNYSTLPRGVGSLVEGQVAYTFASEYLEIEAIDVLDLNGMYRRIHPIDPGELGDLSPEEYFGVTSGNIVKGVPRWYDKLGDTIFLYPAPTSASSTLTNGLRVWFKRTASLFTPSSAVTADTTEPGLPSPYHVILAYMAAIPYCMIYHPDRIGLFQQKKDKMLADMLAFYGRRERDKRKNLSMARPRAFK